MMAKIREIFISKNTYNIIFLCLPLGVFFLPEFRSAYEEDCVLLALFVYLLLRSLNEQRWEIAEEWQSVFIAFAAGCLYLIGWMGFLRGYVESWGRFAAVYPLCLLMALKLKPAPRLPYSSSHRTLLLILFALTFAAWAPLPFVKTLPFALPLSSEEHPGHLIIPGLLSLPILACVALISRSASPLLRGRDHLPLLLAAGLAAGAVWTDNAGVWRLWYIAGEQERAWTPFKYEPISPKEIDSYQAAMKAPLEAARTYSLVLNRIQRKGDLPRYLNWPFFLRLRMAKQAIRLENPALCLQFLPPSQVMAPDKIERMKDLWEMEFLWTMRESESVYGSPEWIWADIVWAADEGQPYALDRWGRVYSFHDDLPQVEWDPKEPIYDAIDLERTDGAFVILRANGRIVSSMPLPLVAQAEAALPLGGAIGMKFHPNGKALLLASAFGEIRIIGTSPEGFPSWKRLHFDRAVVADMELDPDGMGYYLLDIYGAIHSNHEKDAPSLPNTSPPVAKELLPYWAGMKMAVDLEIDPLGRGLYVYNRLGEIFTVAVKPFRETYRPPKIYAHRGVGLCVSPEGRLISLESNGAALDIP
ncbi:MAG: hypothetical protein AB1656_15120 [Candidatus Omnitrophota bacterium]